MGRGPCQGLRDQGGEGGGLSRMAAHSFPALGDEKLGKGAGTKARAAAGDPVAPACNGLAKEAFQIFPRQAGGLASPGETALLAVCR